MSPERERIIKRIWREIARKMKFSGADDYVVDTKYGKLVYKLTIAPRDDTWNSWFAIECEGVLVHCGPAVY